MQRSLALTNLFSTRAVSLFAGIIAILLASLAPRTAAADRRYVEFDFARRIEFRDVTAPERARQYPRQRLVEVMLPVSVRFHGVALDDVEELAIEINGSAAGLQVYDFAPDTQLASDIDNTIESTTTVKKNRSLDGTLGGQLPIPLADAVAHVTPSINAGLSRGEIATEKLNRLPPKYAVVVSGTSSEGRGVFFKLKRSSQTSLEGSHELAVIFIAPANWRGGLLRVGCSARGYRKVFWMEQPATLGQATADIELFAGGETWLSRPLEHRVSKPLPTASGPARIGIITRDMKSLAESSAESVAE